MKYFFLFILVSCFSVVSAQIDSIAPAIKKDTAALQLNSKPKSYPYNKKEKDLGITIQDYKIISHARDTVYLDTTLTIQKEYAYNYIRKDDFELMPFANVGQPYNKLGVSFNRVSLYPRLGAKAKHYNYAEVEDMNYYNVATSMTDLFFKTTLEEGQLLDALLTFNTSRRLNLSIGYKGFRSEGKYLLNQAESGNFKMTSNFTSKDYRYALRAHIAAQNIDTQENGGLSQGALQFESGDEAFKDRGNLDVVITNAENRVLGKRYYLDHKYKLIRKRKDSSRVEKTSLAIGHQFNYETKFYKFGQRASSTFFGDAILNEINDLGYLKTMYNDVNMQFYNATLGKLQASLSLYNYNYYFDSIFIANGQTIPNQLKGEEISLGGNYQKVIKGFTVDADLKYTLVGDLTGHNLNAKIGYKFNTDNTIVFGLHSSSRMPDYNFLLYQSEYINYNWYNSDFEKERVHNLNVNYTSNKWGNLEGNLTTLDNYTYFKSNPDITIEQGAENANIKAYQENQSIQHVKLKYTKEFKLGKFALHNTLMYQNVSQTNTVLNVPSLVTRNTLYYSSEVFKKAMFLQTGINFKYFSAYTMDAYNPLLGEFYIQNNEKLGGYPLLDFFINAKVQQTRIYLKAEHFNTLFGSPNRYYAAPNYPYRDFVIRFGLVWNFFS